jgi:hypothetical protein
VTTPRCGLITRPPSVIESEAPHGWLAAGGCACATSAARRGSTASACWRAAGWRSTAPPTRRPCGPAGLCWPGSTRDDDPDAGWGVAGCPPAACRRADRDHLAAVDQRPEPANGVASPGLASCGKPASPTDADGGDPAAAKSPINAAIQLRECPLKRVHAQR